MPKYRWLCQICEMGNSAESERCEYCNHPAETNGYDIEGREFVLKKMFGGLESFICSQCKGKFHNIEFSEDPQEYYRHGEGSPLFRILFIKSICIDCNYEMEGEFKVPFARWLFRKLFRKDIESPTLKNW